MSRNEFEVGASEHRPVQLQFGNELSQMSDDELRDHRTQARASGDWESWGHANAEFARRWPKR